MRADRLAGLVLVLFAAAAAWTARTLPVGSVREPGPGLFPLALALLLALLGIVVALAGRGSPPVGRLGWRGIRRAAAILGACAFAAYAIERAGYRVTVFALVAILAGGLEGKRAAPTLAVALALAFGSYYLFARLLKVPLPLGPYGL